MKNGGECFGSGGGSCALRLEHCIVRQQYVPISSSRYFLWFERALEALKSSQGCSLKLRGFSVFFIGFGLCHAWYSPACLLGVCFSDFLAYSQPNNAGHFFKQLGEEGSVSEETLKYFSQFAKDYLGDRKFCVLYNASQEHYSSEYCCRILNWKRT